MADELPWLFRLLSAFEAKPAFAGAFASALCLLLVFGIVYAERPDVRAATAAANRASRQPAGRRQRLDQPWTSTPSRRRSRLDSISSTNPVFNAQSASSHGLASQAADGCSRSVSRCREIDFILNLKRGARLKRRRVFQFNQAKCQPKSSRSPTKKAAWAKPPPPSTLPPASPPSASACCSSTSTRRPTPPAALGLEKIEGASAYRVLLGEGSLLDKIKADGLRAA